MSMPSEDRDEYVDEGEEEDEEGLHEVDLERMRALLSGSAFSALQDHLISKSDSGSGNGNGGGGVSVGPVISNIDTSISGGSSSSNFISSSNTSNTNNISSSSSSSGNSADNKKFGKKDYWDTRFDEEREYDWLAKYEDLRKHLIPYLQKSDRILVVGCGNSLFSQNLYDDGFENITNIDFSEVVIKKMSELHSSSRPKMQWLVMDMTNLTFPEGCKFDVVIDKASMDALMVDEVDVWYPNQKVVDSVDAMCKSTRRVLKEDGGYFLQISFAQPHFRTKYLSGKRADNSLLESEILSPVSGYSSRYLWNLKPAHIIDIEQGCLNFYMYIMQCT